MIEDGVTGVLLAGGKSRRMGTDKRSLIFDGEILFNRVLQVLVEVFPEVIVVFGEDTVQVENNQVRVVRDLIPNRAAAGGLYTGIFYSTYPKSFVVACDMPFLNSFAMRYLVKVSRNFDITLVELSQGLQTMHGIYSKRCQLFLEDMVKKENLCLQDLVCEPSLAIKKISESEILPYDPHLRSFMNLNSPADLEFARKIIYSSGKSKNES